MLNLEQIKNYYPVNLHGFEKNILREYLQYKILEIIFATQYANKLSFLGGTALKVVYNNTRFSEGLDFDNFGLTEKNFEELAASVKAGLIEEGFKVEIKNIFKGAYRCKIRLPEILFDNNLSPLKEEKILIQIDTAPHNFVYQPDRKILNKFEIFTQIFVIPPDIILSQKIYAILNRKRAKGRDFYDTIFLLSRTQPNYEYLQQKIEVKNRFELKEKLLTQKGLFDLDHLARDLKPFLLNPKDAEKIKLFFDYIEGL